MLAVLRRPPTAADSLPASLGAAPIPGEGIYSRFVRRALVVAGVSYYLVPTEHGVWGSRCSTGEEVLLVAFGPHGRTSGASSASAIAQGDDFGIEWSPGAKVVYAIVPDGVAKVTIRYSLPRHAKRHASVTTAVVGNVFVASVPSAIARSSFPVVPTSIVWRAASGAVIKTIRPLR